MELSSSHQQPPFRRAITTLQSTARGTAFFNGVPPLEPENPA